MPKNEKPPAFAAIVCSLAILCNLVPHPNQRSTVPHRDSRTDPYFPFINFMILIGLDSLKVAVHQQFTACFMRHLGLQGETQSQLNLGWSC